MIYDLSAATRYYGVSEFKKQARHILHGSTTTVSLIPISDEFNSATTKSEGNQSRKECVDST